MNDDPKKSNSQEDQPGSETEPEDTPEEEEGGPEGLEPTRFGDWERKGRCYDF